MAWQNGLFMKRKAQIGQVKLDGSDQVQRQLCSAWKLDSTSFAWDNRWGMPLEAAAVGAFAKRVCTPGIEILPNSWEDALRMKPPRENPGLAVTPGWVVFGGAGYRGCRYAQPRTNGWHPSGMA
jgi:hypothetical protein